jgi:hypothetical protein
MITIEDIRLLTVAAESAGYTANPADILLLTWNAGGDTHIPSALPVGYDAVYIFKYQDEYLKVGKACGPKATPRYQSQHYYMKAPSTLAKSIHNDPLMDYNDASPRDWLISNTTRFNILIPNNIYSAHFVSFAEAFFILKCNPRYEG